MNTSAVAEVMTEGYSMAEVSLMADVSAVAMALMTEATKILDLVGKVLDMAKFVSNHTDSLSCPEI